MNHATIIVDDEPPARAKLARLVGELPDFTITAEAATVDEAVAAILARPPALVFLDIQLGAHSGFDVLDSIRGRVNPQVVFTTAFADHAVRAFDVQALDYLLKPFDRERFLESVARVRVALAEPDQSDFEERIRRLLGGIAGRPALVKQILVRDAARAYFLDVAAIDRVSAAGNYVEIHSAGRVHLVREPLGSFVAQLDPDDFIRVHRSHVVRVGFIAELTPLFHGDYELLLRDGERLALSRRYKALLPAAIRERL